MRLQEVDFDLLRAELLTLSITAPSEAERSVFYTAFLLAANYVTRLDNIPDKEVN